MLTFNKLLLVDQSIIPGNIPVTIKIKPKLQILCVYIYLRNIIFIYYWHQGTDVKNEPTL